MLKIVLEFLYAEEVVKLLPEMRREFRPTHRLRVKLGKLCFEPGHWLKAVKSLILRDAAFDRLKFLEEF